MIRLSDCDPIALAREFTQSDAARNYHLGWTLDRALSVFIVYREPVTMFSPTDPDDRAAYDKLRAAVIEGTGR